MLLPDHEIRKHGIFNPFTDSEGQKKPWKMGTGLSSYGYDLSLSEQEFKIFKKIESNKEINPKDFSSVFLENLELNQDEWGKYFVLPGHSYGLGFSLEYITMPDNVTGIAVGKSTYARAGIVANITPIECGWEGYLTLEFANTTPNKVRLYANEGVVQLLLFSSLQPTATYSDRSGKYNNQTKQVTLPKINHE